MIPSTQPAADSQAVLSLKAYRGDGSVLLAYDLDQSQAAGLAGFAILRTTPDGKSNYLLNRINFNTPVTNQTTPAQRPYTTSDQAPFQTFRWFDLPSEVSPGQYTYTVTAMYYDGSGGLKPGASASASLELTPIQNGPVKIGFTRGYLSSQAYATKFQNQPIAPAPTTMDFDTTPFLERYQWLGYHAREMVFEFLQSVLNDPGSTLDLFAFDLDEPDVIRMLVQLGPRLRAVLDDCSEHNKPGMLEPKVWAALQQSAGADHIKLGHFTRFSHSKVFIQVKNGTPVRVLAGSANFSVRGLYVQANNIFVFDSPDMAGYYENVFQTAFTNMNGFINLPVAQQWFNLPDPASQPFSVCFSPHKDPTLSLGKAADAIQHANSSVLFAVMQMGGGGDVLADLLKLGSQANIFAYGITQTTTGINVYPPGSANALLTDFAALDQQVPAPFAQEWRGGVGQVIHDKFVVVDFNDQNPMLFTGSSNLSAGGEQNNGDNLIAIHDPVVVQAYAVEAIRLVDHYNFRARQSQATPAKPLQLQSSPVPGQEWWRAFYDPNNIKNRERTLFIK
jgi:hypothetical protein